MSQQKTRVLKAYRMGSRTTSEVALLTGLPIKHCSTYSRRLVAEGKLKYAGNAPREYQRGAIPYWYEPIEAAK
jgi:hypothetical protein